MKRVKIELILLDVKDLWAIPDRHSFILKLVEEAIQKMPASLESAKIEWSE